MQGKETMGLEEVTNTLSLKKKRRLYGRSNETSNDSALIIGN